MDDRLRPEFWAYCVLFAFANRLLSGDERHDNRIVTNLKNNHVGVYAA